MAIHFTRMGSTNVLIQVHVSEDSRYVLLPVMEQPTVITGWLIYDTAKGELLTDHNDEPWSAHHLAREWLVNNHYHAEAG